MAALLHLPCSDAILTIALETSNVQARFDARQQALKARFDLESQVLQDELDHEQQALRFQFEELGYRETHITGDAPADVDDHQLRTADAVTIINVEPVPELAQPSSDCSEAGAGASFQTVLHDALRRLSEFPEYARFCTAHPGFELNVCEACNERLPRSETIPAPCGHSYCTDCLATLFEHATRDESMYPPRCCSPNISLESVHTVITSELAASFTRKAIEFDTIDRTYCSNSTCHQFITTDRINNDVAVCDACGHRTCSICEGNAHHDDCPEDETTQLTLQLADTQQWQRCNDCRSVVERSQGCNHITCRCCAQFCYICGAPWRTCSCPLFGEPDVPAGAANDPRRRIYQPPQAALPPDRNATPVVSAEPAQQTIPAVPAQPASAIMSNQPNVPASPDQSALPAPPALVAIPLISTRRMTLAQRWRMNQVHLSSPDGEMPVERAVPAAAAAAAGADPSPIRLHNGRPHCFHGSWIVNRGRFTCDHCNYQLQESIDECYHCRTHACRRCLERGISAHLRPEQ